MSAELDSVGFDLTSARPFKQFTRGTATKLYGIAHFLEQGIYGRVSYCGLMAIEARQDETATSMAEEIEACFEVIEAVMRFEPKREYSVFPTQHTRFLALSDAAAEADNPGSGGFHLIFFNQTAPKTVSVLLQQTALSCNPSGNRRQPTVPN